ncbi:MAG: hypothetical protein H8E40_15300 [Chloroflexi bacterium]|nr:hypothetical protein [Chloroflexota bacterium]
MRRLFLTAVTAAALIVTLMLSGCLGGSAPRPVAPEIATDGSGGAIIVWPAQKGARAQRVDSQGNCLWGSKGRQIFSYSKHPIVPLAVEDDNGGAILAWTGETESTWSVFAWRLDSQGNAVWNEGGICVSTGTAEVTQSLIDLASDGSGGAVLLWYEEWKTDGKWQVTVYAQRVSASGDCLWGEQGVQVCGTSPDPRWAKVVNDGSGGAVIVWEDNRGPDTDIYAQRISSNGRLLWPDEGVPVASASNAQLFPQIISDGMGNFIVVWVQSPGASYMVGDADIYAQKINPEGKPLWTNGKGVPVCTASGSQEHPQVASDGSGGCMVVWHDTRNRPNRDAYAQRLSSEGKILWETDGVLVGEILGVDKSSVEAGSYDVQVAGDSAGGAMVVWQVNPTSATTGAFKGGEIYAQRLSPTGERLWPEAIRVYENPSLKSQAYSSVVSDGMGGVIISSKVGKGRRPDLVYAQRIDSDGNRLWGEEGIRLEQ